MKLANYVLPIKLRIVVLVLLISAESCYYDSEEFLFPELTDFCNTENATYAGTVQPILQQYCLSCHSNASSSTQGSGIKLEEYADVLAQAQKGSLYGAMAHEGSYSPMPKGSSKLSDCIVSSIRLWIEDGAPNN